MKKLFLITAVIIMIHQLHNISFAQNPEVKRTYHWYFGGQAGIDFSSGTAVADTNGKMGVYAGCSVISDTSGNLLFYTQGETVWNKNHDTLLNGTGLYGSGTPYQGSIIVPQPNNDSIYFIFHQTGFDTGGNPWVYGLNYSVVNMKGDSGLGEVINKNIPLFKPNTEQIAAIHHANKCDVWVMAHEWHTNKYHAFLVTSAGVDTVPVTQIIGNQIPDSSLNNYDALMGVGMKFTNDGKKMASDMFWDNYTNPSLFDTLELYDFNNATAMLSNRIIIPDSSAAQFDFSPDGTKLYVNSGTYDAQTYQYDISSNNQSTILSTKTLLYYDDYWNYAGFQHTPDGKIFIANNGKSDSIPVINNPNASGISCNLVDNGFSLNGRYAATALPNFIQSYFGTDTTDNCLPTDIQEISESRKDDCIHVYPNPFSVAANIEITCEQQKNICQLEIYDVLGNEVFKSEILNQKSEIKRNNLQMGIYFLKIQYNNKLFTQKLLIIN